MLESNSFVLCLLGCDGAGGGHGTGAWGGGAFCSSGPARPVRAGAGLLKWSADWLLPWEVPHGGLLGVPVCEWWERKKEQVSHCIFPLRKDHHTHLKLVTAIKIPCLLKNIFK